MLEETPRRIELKCLYASKDFSRIEKFLYSSELSFYEPYPSRFVNSIYFDTIDLTFLDESLGGTSTRNKWRCRWYGNLVDSQKTTFEIKKKYGHTSWKVLIKDRFEVNPLETDWENFILPKFPEGLNVFGLKCENFFPMSIVRYKRKYFVSANGKIRVTLDDDLKFFSQRNHCVPNVKISEGSDSSVVMELKLKPDDIHLVSSFSQSIRFTPMRFSKYCESQINRILS